MNTLRNALRSPQSAFLAPLLLLVTGSLLAVTIIISRLAAIAGAPMIWFLVIVMAGAGLLLTGLVAATNRGTQEVIDGRWRQRLIYSLGAGGIQAVTMAIVYLSVSHVGVGFISLAFAFPLLLTYVLALGVGMERYAFPRALGVVMALVGGVLIAAAKFNGLADAGGAIGWLLAASAIPLILAGGNLFRTRYWPEGTSAVLLAALMLLIAAGMLVPVAITTEGIGGLVAVFSNKTLMILGGLNIAAFAFKFVAYFKLQHVAGPVYLSQIGSVGAAVGTPIAVLFLGETLPQGFGLAITLIIAGAVVFLIDANQLKRAWRRLSDLGRGLYSRPYNLDELFDLRLVNDQRR